MSCTEIAEEPISAEVNSPLMPTWTRGRVEDFFSGRPMPDHRRSIVLINTFRLKAEDPAKLIALLTKVTEESVGMAPGFRGATLHLSLDGERVVMYAHWQSLAQYEAMRAGSGSTSAIQEIMEIAIFEPGMFEVVCEFQPPDM
ncbi:antibiotic biosynthesis monooxygenase family protein [Neorhizobium sp. DT-125]|uniref:antibiotic biosynthesis monooxygenase family protein n=1 Tax=Neorhizobium sp. DT-125 TaxID=3396163 RepID=UPI003F1D8FAD